MKAFGICFHGNFPWDGHSILKGKNIVSNELCSFIQDLQSFGFDIHKAKPTFLYFVSVITDPFFGLHLDLPHLVKVERKKGKQSSQGSLRHKDLAVKNAK